MALTLSNFRAGASWLALCLGILWVLMLTAFERCPLIYPALPGKVSTPQVKRGTDAMITLDRCNVSSEPIYYIVTRELVNVRTGETVSLPSYAIDILPGCVLNGTALPVPIPAKTKPGTYVDRGVSHVEGRIKHFAVAWISQPFEVTE